MRILAGQRTNGLAMEAMVSSKRPRTRTNDPVSTRSRVLDAAVDLFHRKGYSETSMQDIMRGAQVTSGALHHHYPTKKELGVAVIRERVAAMVEEAWIAPVVDSTRADKGLAKAFKGIIGGLREGAIVGCPLNNLAIELANSEPEFRLEMQQIFDDWQTALAKRIKETKIVPRGSGMTAEDLATLVVAAYSGAMTMAKTSQTTRPLNVTLKLLSRLWKPQPDCA